jgi:hypothetical protein
MPNLNALRKEMKLLKSKMRKECQLVLKEGFKEFFANHPVVKAVCWEQYTPYFNDGDTCTFGVGEFWLKFDDSDDDEAYDSFDSKMHPWGDEPEKFSKEERAAVKQLNKLYKAVVDEDTFYDVFGDHVRVKADRKGFHVDEYTHD